MIEKDEAIKAVQLLADYCSQHDLCAGCVFDASFGCMFEWFFESSNLSDFPLWIEEHT